MKRSNAVCGRGASRLHHRRDGALAVVADRGIDSERVSQAPNAPRRPLPATTHETNATCLRMPRSLAMRPVRPTWLHPRFSRRCGESHGVAKQHCAVPTPMRWRPPHCRISRLRTAPPRAAQRRIGLPPRCESTRSGSLRKRFLPTPRARRAHAARRAKGRGVAARMQATIPRHPTMDRRAGRSRPSRRARMPAQRRPHRPRPPRRRSGHRRRPGRCQPDPAFDSTSPAESCALPAGALQSHPFMNGPSSRERLRTRLPCPVRPQPDPTIASIPSIDFGTAEVSTSRPDFVTRTSSSMRMPMPRSRLGAFSSSGAM